MKTTIVILALFLASCSPQKQLERLLNKHPELLKTDTTYIHDTITLKRDVLDTVFANKITKDTITIHDSTLLIKYFNNGKTVYIKGEVKERKVPVEIPVIHIKYITVKKWYDKLADTVIHWFKWIIIIIILAVFIYFLLKKSNINIHIPKI